MTQAYSLAGTTLTVLVPGSETGGAFSVLHVIKGHGSSTPPHSHDRELELPYVLSGRLSAETEGRVETRGPGEFIILPPGRPHRLFNDSGETTHEVLLCVPAIFDRFVAATGTPVEAFAAPQPMSDEARRRLVETAADFGVRLLRSAQPETPIDPLPMEEPERWDVLGLRVEVLARLGSGDDDLVLLRQRVGPDTGVPLHSHRDPECFVVVQGQLDLYREGDSWRTLGPNQALHVGADQRHAVRNAGSEAVHLLMVSTVRMARFFSEIGSPATSADPRPARPDELAAFPTVAARYGYWLAPPDEDRMSG